MIGLQEKRHVTEVSLLPYDLIFKILLLLPAKDLIKLSIVCKTWCRLIHSPNFVEAHKNRCETVLTFLKHFSESQPNTLAIDINNEQFTLFELTPPNTRKLQICLMEFKDGNGKIIHPKISGFGSILASCDGLVLATDKIGSLLVLNPMTRKLLPLKSGTIVSRHEESYGFVYSSHGREYKAVHVFRDDLRHIDCEILSFKTRSWKGCKVPSFGLFQDFGHKPIAVSGVLYWLPGTHNINYLVSMNINDEKFVRTTLPINSSGMNDRLIEIGGLLNFVAQMTVYRIQIWALNGDDWIKKCTINMDYDITGLIPVFTTKNGRFLIFKSSRDAVYEYDMEEEEMEKVSIDGDMYFNDKKAFPHMNTLASWVNSGPLW